ncbi:MAG: IS1595 family transposase, partial [Pseudomonadota bacterium]
MTSRKKGVSSNQLHRTLEITLTGPWFLSHRIREAMRTGEFDPMGGGGGIVETNETYIGMTDEARAKRARRGRRAVHRLCRGS